MIAVVTDNASNECAALNPKKCEPVQRIVKRHILQIPCFSHGAKLAIADWAKQILVGRVAFRRSMRTLLNEPHSLPRGNPLRRAPRMNDSRWFDWGKAVNYAKEHYR